MKNRNLKQSLREFSNVKEDKLDLLVGELGIPINGNNIVEVPGREGFVFVRLKGNISELIQAYNATVSPIYGLPVLVARQGNVYKIVGRDLNRYQDWGVEAYLPRHGYQHSFNPALGMGADTTWIFSQQWMPLLVFPSETGTMSVHVYPHFYEWEGVWKFAQSTGTPDFSPYVPTATGSARMALYYLNGGDNSLNIVPGTPFSSSISGSANLAQYIPNIPRSIGIPLAAIRLETGTASIGWDNIYDVRPFYVGGTESGTSSGGGGIDTIGIAGQDEGVNIGTGTVLNVTGAGATLSRSGTVLNLNVPGGGGGGGVGVMAWDEGVPLATGTVFNFVGGGVTASVSGSVVNVNVPSATGSSSSIWTQVIDENGTSFANFTSTAGTWSSDGTVIKQTDTSASRMRARYNTKQATSIYFVECQVQLRTSGGDNRGGFIIGYDGTNTGGCAVFISENDTVQAERDSIVNIFSISATVNVNTWYTLKAQCSLGGVSVWLDDTLIGSGANNPSSSGDASYFGLLTYNSEVWFRNIKTWALNTPL